MPTNYSLNKRTSLLMQVHSFRYRALKSLCHDVLLVAGMMLAVPVVLAAEKEESRPRVVPLSRVNPDYPAEIMARGIQGQVKLEFSVDEQGNVIDPFVTSTCIWRPPATIEACAPDQDLTFVATSLEAVAKWKYEPPMEEGVPVRRQGIQTILQFLLQE
jgi:hypothetical protein